MTYGGASRGLALVSALLLSFGSLPAAGESDGLQMALRAP